MRSYLTGKVLQNVLSTMTLTHAQQLSSHSAKRMIQCPKQETILVSPKRGTCKISIMNKKNRDLKLNGN